MGHNQKEAKKDEHWL